MVNNKNKQRYNSHIDLESVENEAVPSMPVLEESPEMMKMLQQYRHRTISTTQTSI